MRSVATPGPTALSSHPTSAPNWWTDTAAGDSSDTTDLPSSMSRRYSGVLPRPEVYALSRIASPVLGLGGSMLTVKVSPGMDRGKGVVVGVGVGRGVGAAVGVGAPVSGAGNAVRSLAAGVGVAVGVSGRAGEAVGAGAAVPVSVAAGAAGAEAGPSSSVRPQPDDGRPAQIAEITSRHAATPLHQSNWRFRSKKGASASNVPARGRRRRPCRLTLPFPASLQAQDCIGSTARTTDVPPVSDDRLANRARNLEDYSRRLADLRTKSHGHSDNAPW